VCWGWIPAAILAEEKGPEQCTHLCKVTSARPRAQAQGMVEPLGGAGSLWAE
jgi:hypothetical protein